MSKKRKEIWVWMDLRTEKFFSTGLGVLALARNLSKPLDSEVVAVLMGPSAESSWLSLADASKSSISHGADHRFGFLRSFGYRWHTIQ